MSAKQNSHLDHDAAAGEAGLAPQPTPDAGFLQAWLENVIVSALLEPGTDRDVVDAS